MQLVEIVWKDIIRPEETWLFKDDVIKLRPAVITTVGWIVDERAESLTVASSMGDDQQLGDINCIPRSVIITIKNLGDTHEEDVNIPIL
jgi:hypothetical protein|tara:strand:- start:2404 stop:2670 length:267 start_codon:yes stop_codon:yes gene_type:complete